MTALFKNELGVGHVELRKFEDLRFDDDQVKIEVSYCGVCGTDLHVYEDTFRNYPPVILGHEFSGQVVEVGNNVRHVTPGDTVTVLPASAVICGVCIFCRTGQFMFCRERRGMGHGINGAFAPYAVVRKDQVYKIPQGLSLTEAALCEPFAAAVQAVTELTNVRLGVIALVSGPGPIGLLCLKLLVAEGVKAIVAGAAKDAARLEMARRIGAEVIVNVDEPDWLERVLDETGGLGV